MGNFAHFFIFLLAFRKKSVTIASCWICGKITLKEKILTPLVGKLPNLWYTTDMTETKKLITGEFSRTVDDRYRLSLPDEFKEVFKPESGKCVIMKEASGYLSLWEEATWQLHYAERIELVQKRFNLGHLGRNITDLQRFGRLLSTRYRHIQLADKARFLIPEGFREFLAIEPKQEVMVIGAAVSIEIWHPQKWLTRVEEDMPQFDTLLESLSH